jgi:hypothetical protein
MNSVRFKFDLHGIRSRKFLFATSLLLIIVIVFSCIFFAVNNASNVMIKTSEVKLREKVNNAVGPTVITLDGDVELTEPFIIPSGKDITITSNDGEKGFYRLIGTSNESTIVVETNGVLRLDGVIVTHEKGVYGNGVFVNFESTLILHSGIICNNTMPDGNMIPNVEWGGGVVNWGFFIMYGGEISSNTAYTGGGVLNYGTFEMIGGKISGNTVGTGGNVYNYDMVNLSGGCSGGGVFNFYGDVSVSGGEISNNVAGFYGGGVFNVYGRFSLSGDGVISGNIADIGGGISNRWGNVSVSGGVISSNVAKNKGGGVHNYYMFSNFNLSGGEISNNTAPLGGGVCNDDKVTMTGGVISGNTANTGGGVYIGNGSFSKSGGTITGNTASYTGNDVYD